MKSTKHILWVVPGFPANMEDESCMPYLQEIIKYYDSQKPALEISILALEYPFTSKKYQYLSCNVIPMNMGNKWYNKPLLKYKLRKKLEEIHRQKPIDIIHDFWYNRKTIYCHEFAVKESLDHITTFMGQDVKSENIYLRNKELYSEIYTITLSNFQRNILREHHQLESTNTLKYGINHTNIINDSIEKKYDIIGVGSLIKIKNYSKWIDVIHKVKLEKKNIQAILIGDGNERKFLQKKITQLGLKDNITLKGQLNRTEIFEFMNQSRLFLHTSDFEGAGFVFIEAISRNLPIVSTPVGLANEYHEILKSNSIHDLAKHVIDSLNQPRIITEFPDIKDTWQKLEHIYTENYT